MKLRFRGNTVERQRYVSEKIVFSASIVVKHAEDKLLRINILHAECEDLVPHRVAILRNDSCRLALISTASEGDMQDRVAGPTSIARQ